VAAFSQIARDEQRHAELAFRFLRWALAQDRVTVTARIELALTQPSASDAATRAVAVPCLKALLASPLSSVESSRAA
jgi:hypothetical protein